MKRVLHISLLVTAVAIIAIIPEQIKREEHPMNKFLSMSNKELNSLDKYDRPDLAALQNFEMTKDPALGYPPTERLLKAHREMKAMNASARAQSSGSTWTERGPNNFGGRTRGIVFDPNDPFAKKVWAAGVAGGLWYNEDITNINTSWEKVDDFFGNLAITTIAYDPNNSNTIYFGTGEGWFNADAVRGNGIWKSTDNGATWDILASTEDQGTFTHVQKIAVTNTSTVLAATREGGGIYRSTDGGTTWTRVVSELRGADIDVVGNTIYASTGIFGTGALWKSTDDGVNWTDISPSENMERIEIATHPNHSTTIYIAASGGNAVEGLYRSYDSGETWESMTIPRYFNSGGCTEAATDFTRNAQAWYDLMITVDPENRSVVTIGGIDIYKSEDAGDTWNLISYWTGSCDELVHADQHTFIFRPGHPDEALAATDGGIYYTTNWSKPESEGGPDFFPRNHNYNVAQFYACAIINERGRDYFLAGAQDNGSHQFFNPGINSTYEITGGDGAFCFIDEDNSDVQITSFVYNNYRFSKDFMDNIQFVEEGDDKGRFINPADYNSNIDMLFAAGDADEIVRYDVTATNVDGETVSVDLGGGAISAVTVSPYDDDVVFVGTGGAVFKITDAAGTPAAAEISNSTISNTAFISSIDVGQDDDHLIVTASNYGVESVFLSTDGGTTWELKEGNLPDMPIRWALFNPSNREEVLLATELGVWMTSAISDASPTWAPVNDGLANVRCDMLQYRPVDGLVAVATHGRGLYTSDIFATAASAIFITQDVTYEGMDIDFHNASVAGTSFSWDFGDGGSSTDENPSHTFASPGVYSVTLEINGDAALTQTQEIGVLPKLDADYALADGGDFESNQSHFYAKTVAGSGFSLGSSTVTGKDGTNSGTSAWVTAPLDATYEDRGEAYLYTPQFDFSNSGEYTLSFFTNYQLEDEWEGFIVEYSIDDGTNWAKLSDYLDETEWYNQEVIAEGIAFIPGEPIFSGETGGYVEKTTTFSDLSGESGVSFRFTFKTDPATTEAGIAIDDFTITAPDASSPALAIGTASGTCLGEVVTFTNESVGDLSDYSWDFGADATPATAIGFGPHDVIYSAGGSKTVSLSATSATAGALNINENIDVNSPPMDILDEVITVQVCDGADAVITITSPESGITYSLYDLDAEDTILDDVVSDGSDFTFTIPAPAVGSYGYRLLASNGSGCDLLIPDGISVESAVSQAIEVTQVDLKRLRASSIVDSYQWYKDGAAIDGATEREIEIDDAGTYNVEGTVGFCSRLSSDFVVDSVLGLEDDLVSSIYPNPADDLLTITLNKQASSIVSLLDLSGSLLTQFEANDGQLSINVNGLKSGVYFLLVNQNGELQKLKFLKK